MKLTELKPKWLGAGFNSLKCDDVKVGITFDCPHCNTRLGIFFKPFIDELGTSIAWCLPDAPDPNTGESTKNKFWERTGDSFESLTLNPSIDVKEHWHGHIINGEVT